MQVLIRLSWYLFDPNDKYSTHLQEVCDQGMADMALDNLLAKARLEGITTKPKRIVRRRYD